MTFFQSRVLLRLLAACSLASLALLVPILAAPVIAQADSAAERMTRLARAGETNCAEPWSYSRGLGKCICIKAGYSKQWGQCLPVAPEVTGALPEASDDDAKASRQAEAAPANPAAAPAARMEQVARAQDCLSSLGLFDGAVDGEGDQRLQKAYSRFAEARGLPASDDLLSVRAQAALQGACGERWVSAKAE